MTRGFVHGSAPSRPWAQGLSSTQSPLTTHRGSRYQAPSKCQPLPRAPTLGTSRPAAPSEASVGLSQHWWRWSGLDPKGAVLRESAGPGPSAVHGELGGASADRCCRGTLRRAQRWHRAPLLAARSGKE